MRGKKVKKTLKKLVVFWIAAVMMFESAAPIRAYALPLPEQEEAEEAEEEILCADGLTAEEYAEKKEEYLAKEGKQSESPSKSASGYIGNSYIKAYINGDGNYNIGTTDNDCLLYHFPDGKTSQTLIRVDGYDYYFDDYCSNVTVGEEEATAVAVIDGVTVTQTLKVVTNPNSSTNDFNDNTLPMKRILDIYDILEENKTQDENIILYFYKRLFRYIEIILENNNNDLYSLDYETCCYIQRVLKKVDSNLVRCELISNFKVLYYKFMSPLLLQHFEEN